MSADWRWKRRAPVVAQRMAEAATTLLAALSPTERAAACFPFAGDERYHWHYTPGPRNGLRLKDMVPAQRAAATALFDAALSLRGAHQARQIIAHEIILREAERLTGESIGADRDPELYYFSVFGDPAGAEPWAWRANGHHLALHFTVVDGDVVAPTPLFFGANPAEVRHGAAVGQRILAEEEDLARALLASLEPAHKAVAVVGPASPGDILTRNERIADPGAIPRGIRFALLGGEQRAQMVTLIRHYCGRAAHDLSDNAWARIEAAGLDALTFAWAGGEARGEAHYYAITGPTFLIEYDNSQNDANHVHTVWRDLTNDWDLDVLAHHYAVEHEAADTRRE